MHTIHATTGTSDKLRHAPAAWPLDVAAARRQAVSLRTEERRLAEQVRKLRHEMDSHRRWRS